MGIYVAVIGPGEGATNEECNIARNVGKAAAQSSMVLVCGGLRGVMAAAAEGCIKAGGKTIGILPTLDKRTANEFLSFVIPTTMGELRNGLVVGCADGVIAIGGSWGTLSEIGLARRQGLPVISVGGWTVIDVEGKEVEIIRTRSAAKAVQKLKRLIKK